MRSRTIVLAAALLALAGCSTAVPSPVAPLAAAPPSRAVELAPVDAELARKLETLAADIEADRLALHLPGLALAIVQDGRLIFARGFGLADVETGRAVTPETLFAIGSTTKAFTATLAGMLADEGKLAYDDPVTRHIPWFTPPVQAAAGEELTLRDLLAHRTGFARMDILWYGGKASREEVLRTAIGAEPMAPFRKEFHYNNVMYLAAGEACAAAAGASWDELVAQRFFEPLGMRDSSTTLAAAQADPRLALGYRWDEEKQFFEHLPMRDLAAIGPAGAINSNVLDLARWVRFLLDRGELEGQRLVSAERLAETWKEHNSIAPGRGYGLGWMLATWNGEPVAEHGGNIAGFAAEIALLPGRRTGIALLTNVTMTPLQGTIWSQVFEALYGAPASAGDTTAAPELAGDLARYTGTYVASFFQFKEAPFEVRLQGDELVLDIPGQGAFELAAPGADGKRPFVALPDQIQVAFDEASGADGSKQVVALKIYQAGFAFECFRKAYEPPAEAALEDFAPYLGSYADPANGKTMSVVLQHNRLAVDYPEQMVYELHAPDHDDKWVFRATDQLAVAFHLDADGVAEALTFHERGTLRVCERTDDGPGALPALADVLALRRGAEFEARVAALGPCRLHWALRFVHCGIRGTSTLLFDARGRFHEEVDLAPFVTTSTTCDGERVVSESSLEATHELLGANRDASFAASALALFGDWQRHFDEVRVVKAVADGARKIAVVKLEKGAAPAALLHVDLASGDIVRAELQELVDGVGPLSQTLTFEGWHERKGLRLPARIVAEDDATGRVVTELVALETGVDGAALERLPALDAEK